MIETYLRPLYQQCLVRPILNWFKSASPTTITLLACSFGILVAPALYYQLTFTAIILLLLSGYLDTVYTTVAKVTGKLTVEVSLIDIVADRIVEFSAILGLFSVNPSHRGWMAMFMLGACYIYMTVFLIVALYSPHEESKRFKYSPGLIERTEAFIFFIAMILFQHYFLYIGSLFTVLVLLTSAFHVHEFMQFRSSIKKNTSK